MKLKLIVLVFLAAMVLLSGCPQPQDGGTETPAGATEAESPTPQPSPSPEETPTPEERLELPLAISYRMPFYKEDEKIDQYVVYYLEKEIKCSGRNAVAGVLNSYGEGESPEKAYWAKFTLYLDNGEFASSGGIGKSALAFDDAEPKRPDYAIITQLNSVFAANGENFNSSNAWESDIPVLLKDIYYAGSNTGDLIGSLSIVKKGESKEHAVPCTEFSVNVKSETGFSGETIYCLAALDNEIGLPYTVSITVPQMEKSNDVELDRIEKVSSGAAFYPQCLEPVYCAKPDFMSEDEREACTAQGMTVQEIRDEDGCITSYECLSELEWAKRVIMESQPSHCPEPGEEFIQEAMKCIKTGSDPKSLEVDEQGCFISIDCSQPQE